MFRLALTRVAVASREAALRRVNICPRSFSTTMSRFQPNTQPPKGFSIYRNVAELASESDKFRRVLWTGTHSQLVIMTVPVGGEIGQTDDVHPGDLVIVPAGTMHNFKNLGPTPLIVATIYAPAEHKADTVHDSLEQGEKLEEEGKDEPPSWAKEK
ncbi:hypothetical protein NUW54_g4434 [Trametes sanguinea]|uniref:Uncharacterized protein n=1 Tax=Trametes sanguinea TaxID=158606 RepID=A0ACC1PZ72_9APHY|nr:hypothetical protein NUW54_g4434 [Trametes sanguinea]